MSKAAVITAVSMAFGLATPLCRGVDLATDGWPLITALPLSSRPQIDGRLAPGEWDGATTVSGFHIIGRQHLAGGQPMVKVAWDDHGLMIAAVVPLPPGQEAKARVTDWDGTVWEDDSIEVHLDCGHGHGANHQFVVNALGAQFDALGGDSRFNASWEAAALNRPGMWSVELLIPWVALDRKVPEASAVDGFNVTINSSWLGGTLTWSDLTSSAHDSKRYGHLLFGRDLAVALEDLKADDYSQVGIVALGRGQVEIEYRIQRTGPDASAVIRQALQVSAPGRIQCELGIQHEDGLPVPGVYALSWRASGPTGPLLTQSLSLEVQPPITLALRAFILEPKLTAEIKLLPSRFPAADTDVELTVTGADGSARRERLRPDGTGGMVSIDLSADVLPPGLLDFRITATNRRTGWTSSIARTLDSPLAPAWLGTDEGLSDEVPAPWPPMSADGSDIGCWGRVYSFGGGPFPTQVTTAEAAILASPITLSGRVNGQLISWQGGPGAVTSVRPERVVLRGDGESSHLRLRGTVTAEYDGMLRIDLSLIPDPDGVALTDLTLEVPLEPEHARYLYHFPGRWGSVDNSGFLAETGWEHGFKPFVWLGDEDRGLAWFCESDRNWFPADSGRALAVTREPRATVLRCRLVEGEITINAPLDYTFGFQATPAKKPEATAWDYRLTHHGAYGLEEEIASAGNGIRYPALGNIRATEGSFECWYRPGVDSERQLPADDRKYMWNRSIFTVACGGSMSEGTNCGLYWNELAQGLVAWARTEGVVTDNPHTSFDWKAGEWHHIAITWSDQLRIYLDGEMLSESPNHGFLAGSLDQATITIGEPRALATIDEVRILGVARAPQIPDAEFEADDETLLLDHFEAYRKPGSVTLGQADPVLQFTPARFGMGPNWAAKQGQTRLQQLAGKGARTICFHEHWVPYQSYPHPVTADVPRLKSLVSGCHENGLNLLLYMSRQLADNAPEWELYGREMLQAPLSGAYRRKPEQSAHIACWRSPYRDFCLYHLARTLDEFGHDGWYLDGPEWPMECTNRLHGCGYLAEDGTVRPTWDIFATREFMQRLYILTRRRRPQAQLNIHNSTVMVIPTLIWGTSTWGGEQIDTIKPPARTLDFLPMAAFRTEFMGRQWGVPSEFLVYDGMPYYGRDVLAYTLLHGVLMRPLTEEMLELVSALWRVDDEFPMSDAEMIPYWDDSGGLSCTPEGVYVSGWRRPEQGLLLVVSNLSEEAANATVRLRRRQLGLGPSPTVTDALTGNQVQMSDDDIALGIGSWRYRVLRIRSR